jgi:MoxR-like ATPase
MYIKLSKVRDIKTYTPSSSLKSAFEIARSLGRPLLLAGKPGTGKTQFAHWIATQENYGYNNAPFVFITKSSSVYHELFYHYDAVSHFRTKDESRKTSDFIELTALGLAIVCAKGLENISDEIREIALRSLKKTKQNPDLIRKKSVVLIDEVDKAPRDFPNDLLHEIENASFMIKELGTETIGLEEDEKENLCIILTSNFEKSLPDAFLRRCIFFHIEFPDKPTLLQIIITKLNLDGTANLDALNSKLDLFYLLHASKSLQKNPATAECIDWINYLNSNGLLGHTVSDPDFVKTLNILLKTNADIHEAKKILKC